jgi:hypothetical protein
LLLLLLLHRRIMRRLIGHLRILQRQRRLKRLLLLLLDPRSLSSGLLLLAYLLRCHSSCLFGGRLLFCFPSYRFSFRFSYHLFVLVVPIVDVAGVDGRWLLHGGLLGLLLLCIALALVRLRLLQDSWGVPRGQRR